MKAEIRRAWIGAICSLVFSGFAWAHGDYAWIDDGGYKGTDGLHCCGAVDCMEIPAESALPLPDGYGYSTPRGNIANKGVYHSRDGKTWICRFQSGPPKCLFIPGGG